MTKNAEKAARLKAMRAWVRKTAMVELKRIYRMVRMLRRKHGMSVEELSAKSGVTEYLIRRIESGAMPRVTLSKLAKLAFVLAGDISKFFTFAMRGYRQPREPVALTKLRKLLQQKG